MANLLAKGEALMTRLMMRDASPAGQCLLYRKAGGNPIDLTGKCWVGESEFVRQPDENQPAVTIITRDYLIPAENLHCDPEEGDRFVEVINGKRVEFEVLTQLGEPGWRWSDSGRTIYRAHTKEVC